MLAGPVLAQREGNVAFWSSPVATFMGGEGQTGSVETTALAAYAMLRARYDPQLSTAAMTYLIQTKDGAGTWYRTGSTESDNRYARDGLGSAAIPSQRLHFIEPEHGFVTARYKIELP